MINLDIGAFALSGILLAICVSLIVYLRQNEISLSAIGMAVFVAPVVFYLVFSVTVSEISGLGVKAKFQEITKRDIGTDQIATSDIIGTDALVAIWNSRHTFSSPST